MSELKKRPFCGGEARIKLFTRKKRLFIKELTVYEVVCTSCDCRTPLCYTPEIAKDRWNRRDDDGKISRFGAYF